jgi:hypothetical protein
VETLGAARLAKDIPAQRAVATIVPREEITAILRDPEADPALYLRITGEGFDEGDDRNVIGMTWSRAELEDLLERATGEQVVLTFDRDELAAALGDVEAHGLRERALVFAVVAAGALGTGAGIANAMPSGDEGGPAVTAPAVPGADVRVTDASSGAGYTAPAAVADSSVTDVSSAAGYAAASEASASDSIISDAASGAGYVAPSGSEDVMVTDASSAAGYTTTEASSGSIVSDAASGAGYAAPASPQDAMLTDASSASGYAATAEGSAADAMRTDASLSGGYGPADTTGGGSLFTVHTPSQTDGLLAGGVLLAIAGATFAARRSTGTVRPA